jgi:dephospho-CoA kinase
MKTIGLTGGIGMGKSTAAQLLRTRGVPVVDTDDLAREVVEPGQPALAEIQKAFGSEIVDLEGRLDREKLATIVFADSAARSRLEEILHPRIHDLWRERIASWKEEEKDVAVVVIPLLFETKVQNEFNKVVCLACSVLSQRQRLMNRGWSSDHIVQRIKSQIPIEQKIALSDYVVWTEGDIPSSGSQLERILRRL